MAVKEISKQLSKKHGEKCFLYQKLHGELRTQIESGSVKAGQRLPSISNLMKQWSLDYRTVVAGLKLLEKGRYIALENGRGAGPLVIWKKLKQQKINLAFVKWCDNPQFVNTALGVRHFVEKHGLNCTFLDARQSHDYVLEMIKHQPKGIDGVLLYPWDTAEYRKAIGKAIQNGSNMVFLDRYIPGMPISSVTPDHFGGAYTGTKHLLDVHKMPVYYFGMPTPHSSRVDRFRGWAEAMREYDYDTEPYICRLTGSESEASFTCRQEIFEKNNELAKELFSLASKQSKRFSVFCYNGNSIKNIYAVAEQLGLKVGQDVYVVGFMPASFGGNVSVPLTRVLQDDEEVGYEAAWMLYRQITGELNNPLHEILPVRTEIRESSVGQRQRQPLPIVESDKQERFQEKEIISGGVAVNNSRRIHERWKEVV